MRILLKQALYVCALVMAFVSPAVHADEMIGFKNDPRIQLGPNLASLLGPFAPSIEPSRGGVVSDMLLDTVPFGATQRIDYSASFVDSLPTATGDAQWNCLTEALYFEARGESIRGIFAVAEVILNRVDSARFPSSVCRVVNQGTGRKFACQFTYTCDGIPENVREKWAWRQVGKIARLMLDGGSRPLTEGALYYHTRAVSPYWSRVFDRTVTIGAHHFYAQS
ncbi:cell wall hydrolase [Palleronia aestuarii]|nr:cell wall hydrolase [Palleronia aestuarii]